MKVKESRSRKNSPNNSSRRVPGDTNLQKWGFDIHPEVFFCFSRINFTFRIGNSYFSRTSRGGF